jgi:hypothetical protein
MTLLSTADHVLDANSKKNAEHNFGNKNADVHDIDIKKTLTSDSISSLWSYGNIAENATDRVLDATSKENAENVGNKNADVHDIQIKKTLTSDSVSFLWSYGDIAKNASTTVGKTSTGASVFSMDTAKIRNNRGSSTPPFLTRVSEHINSKVLSFFSAAEARVEAMCSCSPDSEESSVASVKTEYEVEVADQAQPRRSLMPVVGCSGGHQQATSNSRNDGASTIDTYTFDETLYSHLSSPSGHPDVLNPKAQALLKEIDDSFFSLSDVVVRETESTDSRKNLEIKAMAAIKQHLLEQQQFLKDAPKDAKNGFYKSVSRAAALNAEVAARQAELESKKIRLQSLQVQEQMDLLSVGHGTFDSSVDENCLSCCPMSTTNKSRKVQKNRRGLMTAE